MSKSYSSTQRPYKVWSSDRQTRKSITASNLAEFKVRAAEKLAYTNYLTLKVVLEEDGTEVEDETYFQSAEKDTVFLLLRDSESWLAPGMDALKSSLAAIPQIVCDTINTMKVAGKAPTWSIKDDQGFITVILQWEHEGASQFGLPDYDDASWKLSSVSQPHPPSYAQFGEKVYSSTFPRPSASRAKFESSLRGARSTAPSLDAFRSALPSKTLSADDFSFIDRAEDFSSAHDLTSICDFHCSSLHREGGSIKVSKSVGTSPIPDLARTTPPPPPPLPPRQVSTFSRTTSPFEPSSATAQLPDSSVAQVHPPVATIKAKKGPVRFMDNSEKGPTPPRGPPGKGGNISLLGLLNGQVDSTVSSDESETETTEREDEQLCERYLLLVDQLSANQKKHLTIKDIGIILERLRSKILDVAKLERDKENVGCHNWLLKATIRGEMLREIGVVYNGQYYGLMEHPGFF